MPTLSKDMIAEIEHEMADLIEEIAELRKENTALHAELLHVKSDQSMPVNYDP